MNFLGSNVSRRLVWLASGGLILFTCLIGVQAQGPAPESAAESGAAKPADLNASQGESLAEIIWGGGVIGLIFYAVLAALSIAAMAIILERMFNLRREKIAPQGLSERLLQLVRAGLVTKSSLEELIRGQTSPLANVLEAATLRAGRPLNDVEKGVEDAAAWELHSLRSHHKYLSVIANVAPLVGLLGTVVGMIIAFRVSSQAGLGKGELLAKGIYIALLTTAIGLMIAIPCLLFAAWFNTRLDRYVREINLCLIKTLPSFARLEAPAPATSSNGTHQPAASASATS